MMRNIGGIERDVLSLRIDMEGHMAKQLRLTKEKYGKLLTIRATPEMCDYVKRKGLQAGGVSGAQWVRDQVFKRGWENEHAALKKSQKV